MTTTTTTTTKSGKQVRIRVRPVGQGHGCCGELVARNGRVLASTEVLPHGFAGAAIDAALRLAEQV